MAFSENLRAKRENDFGIENALAGYCRRQWPDKPIPHIQRTWALTESEASNVLYGHASKRTLNKILHHKRGGPFLFCELVADVCGLTVADIIETQAERIAREADTQRQTAARLRSLACRLGGGSDADGVGASLSGPASPGRASEKAGGMADQSV